MKVNLKTTSIKITPAIEQYLNHRIEMIERFVDSQDESVIMDIELERILGQQQSGRVFRTEINLKLTGSLLRGEAVEYDLYTAINEAKKEIVKQIKNHYGSKKDKFQKKARFFKRTLKN